MLLDCLHTAGTGRMAGPPSADRHLERNAPLITITRRQARRLRAAFRRHALGIAHKGLVPPLVFHAEPAAGVRVRHRQSHLAVECLLEGANRPEGVIAVALEALADFEGRDDSPVILEAAEPGRTLVRWDDRGIPQRREYAVPEVGSLPPFPEPPAAFEESPAGLLDALTEAAATTEEGSPRYALDCIQWKGATSEVVATDGRQILIQGGFRLPWDGDLLVRATPLFGCRELPRDRPIRVGKTDTHVVLRAGSWTLFLTIQVDARFPRVEHVVSDARFAATRLTLDPQDAEFLGQTLERLPGGDELNAPVTVECNGNVAVRARAGGQERVTELVLARSGYSGEPVRLHTSRAYLARAVRLGFGEVCVSGPDAPVFCRDDRKSYLWQPLSKEAAIGRSADAVRIESTHPGPATGPAEMRRPVSSMLEPTPRARPEAARNGPTNGVHPNNSGATGLAALIQEAVALHEMLAGAKARTHRLIGALRRHRKQSRLVASTLQSLKELRLQEVAE